MKRKQQGFSLIEILVVLLIMGITIAFVSLAVGDFGQSRRIESAARQLSKLIEVAEQEAILVPNIMGLQIDEEGYRFYRFILDPKHPKGRWEIIARDNVFRARKFPKNSEVKLSIGDGSPTAIPTQGQKSPRIIISTTGDITPFILEMGTVGDKPSIQLTATFDGEIVVKELPQD